MSKKIDTKAFNVAPIKTSYAAPTTAATTPTTASTPAAPTKAFVYVKPPYPHSKLPVLTDADVPKSTLMQTLYRALRSRRAGDSMSEAKFVAWLVNRLPVTMVDAAGNVHVDMRQDPTHRTMFTSHTDTVHRVGGSNEIRLDVQKHRTYWRAGEGACLGADDGAGIALMHHMIEHGIPAYYIFFRGEESGGIGSQWLAEDMPQAIKDIDRCISLDRADYADVITHQGWGRCCSDAFALALAQELTTDDFALAYLPDDSGVFTDSANLVHLIPECTNLSVGYKNQHGDGEWQDVTFLQRLAKQLVTVNWDKLPTVRDPKAREKKESIWGFGSISDASTHNAATISYGNSYNRDLDDNEQLLVDALYEASQGYTHSLREIVAEWLMPEDPQSVINRLNPHRINISDLNDYAAGLNSQNYIYDEILDILGQDMQ